MIEVYRKDIAFKNILILGVARCGKTTLSNRIKSDFPNYNLVHMDAIHNAILKNMSEVWSISENFIRFQSMLLEVFNLNVKYDKIQSGIIMEGSQIYPSIADTHVNRDNTVIIALGHGKLTVKEKFNLCRQYDKETDWSYNISDEELREKCDLWDSLNNRLIHECPIHNIKYFDTSRNREEKLENAYNYILENIVIK